MKWCTQYISCESIKVKQLLYELGYKDVKVILEQDNNNFDCTTKGSNGWEGLVIWIIR
jgi:hypothetical protein